MGLRADVALPENIESPTGMDHNSLPMGFLDSTPPKVTSPPGGKSIQQQTNGFHSIPKSEERPSLLEATNGLIARSAPCVPHFANREGYGHLPTSQALHVQVNGHTKSGQSQQESGPSTWLDSGSTSLMSAPSPAVTKTTVDDQLKTASVSDLNKALEVFRPKVPAKVAAVHDDNPRPGPSNVGRREEGRGEEVQKRRVIADKIDKTKAHSHFNFFMSHFDTMNSTQLAINLRRLIRKRVADVVLPSAVLRHTLCEDPPPHSAPVTTATASSAAIERDDEATDLETEDNNDQTGTLRELFYERQHARAIATEQRILGGILSIDDEIGEIVEQLAKHKAMKTSFGSLEHTNEDAGCARARPALVHGRFNFLKEEQKKIRPDYFLHEPSTSRVQAYVAAGARIPSIEATDNDIPMEERMQTRLLHLGTTPSFTLRNRLRTPLWKLNTEMVEEQKRCGMKRSQQREEEREEKRRRREERAEKRTEETDHPRYSEDSDEDYVPGSKSRSHGIVKTKSRRGRKPGSSKPARDVPLQLIKLGRRPSTASTFRPRTSTLNDIDDVVFDTSLTGLPAKIDYKEIPIPDWKVETEPSWADSLAEDPCSFCAAGEPLKVEIAARHHPIEFSERRRFQAFRARAAEAAQKREEGEDRSRENTEERLREEEEDDDLVAAPVLLTPPSKISNLNFSSSSLDEPMLMEVPAVVPPFDPLPFLSPEKTVPDYERLSSCAPYPPRTFVL